MNLRERLKDKQRIVIKVGSSSLVHAETGALNLTKLDRQANPPAEVMA
jgi:glutamate 5-kinase